MSNFDSVQVLSEVSPDINEYSHPEEIEEKGYRLVGVGDGRWVFGGSGSVSLPRGYVIKVARSDFASAQARVEASIWEMATQSQRDFLAPVVDSGNSYVIMKEAKNVGRVSGEELNDRIQEMENTGLKIRDVNNPENWGYIDGKLVLVDYGDGVA